MIYHQRIIYSSFFRASVRVYTFGDRVNPFMIDLPFTYHIEWSKLYSNMFMMFYGILPLFE
jgi:hypothetical protein